MNNLQIISHIVKKIDFTVSDLVKPNKSFNINPKVRLDIAIDKNICRLSITLTIKKSEEQDSPFDLEVLLMGSFKILRYVPVPEMTKEACTRLYPFLIGIVANLTATANMPPYYLPFLDFDKVYDSITNEKDKVKIRVLDEEV